jgi:hypothetical protein
VAVREKRSGKAFTRFGTVCPICPGRAMANVWEQLQPLLAMERMVVNMQLPVGAVSG